MDIYRDNGLSKHRETTCITAILQTCKWFLTGKWTLRIQNSSFWMVTQSSSSSIYLEILFQIKSIPSIKNPITYLFKIFSEGMREAETFSLCKCWFLTIYLCRMSSFLPNPSRKSTRFCHLLNVKEPFRPFPMFAFFPPNAFPFGNTTFTFEMIRLLYRGAWNENQNVP